MTARFYHIEDNNFTIDFNRESWRIRIYKKLKGNKAGKAESSINGYWSFKCAENDLPRLHAHMSQAVDYQEWAHLSQFWKEQKNAVTAVKFVVLRVSR